MLQPTNAVSVEPAFSDKDLIELHSLDPAIKWFTGDPDTNTPSSNELYSILELHTLFKIHSLIMGYAGFYSQTNIFTCAHGALGSQDGDTRRP